MLRVLNTDDTSTITFVEFLVYVYPEAKASEKIAIADWCAGAAAARRRGMVVRECELQPWELLNAEQRESLGDSFSALNSSNTGRLTRVELARSFQDAGYEYDDVSIA